MDNNKLGIACDHAGYELKEFLVGYLGSKGYDVYDFGTNSPESVDYPDYAHPLANAIEKGELPRGIAPQHRLRRRTPPTPHRQNSALRLHRT